MTRLPLDPSRSPSLPLDLAAIVLIVLPLWGVEALARVVEAWDRLVWWLKSWRHEWCN